ncbi:hypothetical protein K470DRAFT_271330 [Piedraia hortae CBS 480.64]|uniref:Uncharacterized protein n=1 Tax=Piedraia hortae CBS 480.64 TaxID=1314780 RepID=A0A6A7BYH6_9PEZI|nr:hypothetical protein K470DRAFT_271330 [Piedraia hortae CBS 480.64]
MTPDRHRAPRISTPETGGRWLPPKAVGGNQRQQTWSYYFDGSNCQVSGIPPDSHLYSSFSIYHDHGHFFTVAHDATMSKVGDGKENSAAMGSGSDSEDSPVGEDDAAQWSTLSFRIVPPYIQVGQFLEHRRLPLRRPDQKWTKFLLTDAYQASLESHETEGLIGELALLLALLALAIPDQQMNDILPSCVKRYLSANLKHLVCRGAGWVDRRGIVVSVFLAETTSVEALREFERGAMGPLFL